MLWTGVKQRSTFLEGGWEFKRKSGEMNKVMSLLRPSLKAKYMNQPKQQWKS